MFKQIAKWFKREQLPQVKKIAFIDGDQPLPCAEGKMAQRGACTHHVDIIKMETKA